MSRKMPRAMLPLWRCKSTSFLSSEVNMSVSQRLRRQHLLTDRSIRVVWNSKTTTLAGSQPSQNSSQGLSFAKVVQVQGHKVKSNGATWKVLSQGIHTCNMKGLIIVFILIWKSWQSSNLFKSKSNFKVKVTRLKSYGFIWKVSLKKTYLQYDRLVVYLFLFESYGQGHSFSKVGQTSTSRSQGRKLWCIAKGTRNTHMKYESHIWNSLKVMANVKFISTQPTPTWMRTDSDTMAMT